jgi:xanthine dehydrogenase accessory factor
MNERHVSSPDLADPGPLPSDAGDRLAAGLRGNSTDAGTGERGDSRGSSAAGLRGDARHVDGVAASDAASLRSDTGGASTGGLPRGWVPALARFLSHEPVVARVVVAQVQGSAPREPGAFMLVGRANVEGTIGGGRLEWEAIAAARELLDATNSSSRLAADSGVDPADFAARDASTLAPARLNKVVLAADVGQCCGGVVSLWLERFTRDDLDLLHTADVAGARGAAVWSTSIHGSSVERSVVCRSGAGAAADQLLREPRQRAQPLVIRDPNRDITFLERRDDDLPAVWLYGAGHVGQALARILMELPLRLTWIDSRTEMFPDTLPEGVRVLQDPDTLATVPEAPVGAYFVVMSHSHPLDYALCHALLERNDFGWLGLIGSDSKAARFRSRLTRAGLGADVIANLVCPIGVAGIKSKWPAAIAVGVAAQLLQQISSAAKHPELLHHSTALLPVPHKDCSSENCATCGTARPDKVTA